MTRRLARIPPNAAAAASLVRRVAIILLPLLVAAILPVWTVWYIGPWEATAEHGAIWLALRTIPDNLRKVGVAAFVANHAFGISRRRPFCFSWDSASTDTFSCDAKSAGRRSASAPLAATTSAPRPTVARSAARFARRRYP